MSQTVREIAEGAAHWIASHYRDGIEYEIGKGNLPFAEAVIKGELESRFAGRVLASTEPLGDAHLRHMEVARHLLPEPGPSVVGECLTEIRRLQAENDERGREVERLRAALETVGEELSVMYGRYEPTGSPSEDYAQMSEGLRIAREALAATLPAESADQEADRLMSVIKRQQDRLDRQSAALRGMNEQVVSGLTKNKSLQRSMKNVFMLAKRELSRTKPRESSKSKEIWGHLHRLCIEAGCESSILRNATPGGQPDTEVVVPFDEDEPCMCKRCEADRASSTTPPPMPPAHVYTSTACQHGLHDRCRKACKFCGVACACSCHATEATPPAQEHPDTARLDWLFGQGEGPDTKLISQILMDTNSVDEARQLIDMYAARTAPEAQR